MAEIRLAAPGDAAAIAAIYAPIVRETMISFELEPPDAAEIARRIAETQKRHPWLVCVDGAELLGYAYASRYRERAAYQWSVDVSVYVHPARQRRGVGRALYSSLFAVLRLQGFYAAHAGIALPNSASVGLHESLGFVPVGVYRGVGYKLGRWGDVGWWQLALQERPAAPLPPLAPADAAGLPGWAKAMAAGLRLLARSEGEYATD